MKILSADIFSLFIRRINSVYDELGLHEFKHFDDIERLTMGCYQLIEESMLKI